ncbi:hypothetical protein RugamoR1_10530 [Rugamonas sp. R1(2021)]
MFSASGATPNVLAMSGTAVVITVPSRFSIKKAPATSKAIHLLAVGAGVLLVMSGPGCVRVDALL